VRNYGSRIIQLRSVEVAEHRTYNYNLDEESNEYRLTHASSITSRSLYEKGRLATIMSGLSPEDRVAIDWGQKLQEAAVGFREFCKYYFFLILRYVSASCASIGSRFCAGAAHRLSC
jgi:hypothetical protein